MMERHERQALDNWLTRSDDNPDESDEPDPEDCRKCQHADYDHIDEAESRIIAPGVMMGVFGRCQVEGCWCDMYYAYDDPPEPEEGNEDGKTA